MLYDYGVVGCIFLTTYTNKTKNTLYKHGTFYSHSHSVVLWIWNNLYFATGQDADLGSHHCCHVLRLIQGLHYLRHRQCHFI